MITVCQLWNYFRGRENTSQLGHTKPSNFISWLHEEQIAMQNKLIEDLGNNQTVTDNLRPFAKSVQIAVSDFISGSIIPYPVGYRRFSSLRYFSKKINGVGCLCADIPLMDKEGNCKPVADCGKPLTEEDKVELANSEDLCENSIDMIPNQKWGSVCQHEIVGPSLELPYATQFDKGFKVLPKKLGYVVLDYIEIPILPVFKFTEIRHKINCIAGSTSVAWGEEMLPEILSRLKVRYNAFIRNEAGYSEGEKETEKTMT